MKNILSYRQTSQLFGPVGNRNGLPHLPLPVQHCLGFYCTWASRHYCRYFPPEEEKIKNQRWELNRAPNGKKTIIWVPIKHTHTHISHIGGRNIFNNQACLDDPWTRGLGGTVQTLRHEKKLKKNAPVHMSASRNVNGSAPSAWIRLRGR